MNIQKSKNQGASIFKRGFTIVEMLIVAPIVILVIGVFISAIVSMTGDALVAKGSNTLAYNIKDSLSRIKQDIKDSGAFLATNNVSLTSPQGYNNDTTNFHNADSTNGTMLILNSYATTKNPLDSASNSIYAAGLPNQCDSAQINKNPAVLINIVYFVKNGTLWRRVLAPSNYATVGCSIPWQQPSCAPGFTTPSFCKTQDVRLVDGIGTGGFSVNYYPNPVSTTANTIASDNSQTDSARLTALQTTNTAAITIASSITLAGRDVSQSSTLRTTGANNNISAPATSTSKISALVVGGGGGGGGVIYKSSYSVTPGSMTVTVGSGGDGSSNIVNGNVAQGGNGGNSLFGTIVAVGGGGGGAGQGRGGNTGNGLLGGSGGGGGSAYPTDNTQGIKGNGMSGQGYDGADGSTATSPERGGGGGGAGGVGGNSTTGGGNGGPGIANSISGTSKFYAAGGGGGSYQYPTTTTIGLGGSSIGGNGATMGLNNTPTSGVTNTGSGGGSATEASVSVGGNGGSGVVIISYPTGSISATGGTITTSGGNTIHTFTSSGTFIVSPSSVKVLVVAGGGGGGMDMGGGGGGGGIVYNATFPVTKQSYAITVGAGGNGAPAGSTNGQPAAHQFLIPAINGQNSSITAKNVTLFGSSSSTAGKSCYSLKLDGININGAYWIDPDGQGGNTPFKVYCDMTYNGGGWTMMMKATTGTTFNYNSTYWTTTNTLNTNDATTNDSDAKFRSFNESPVKDLMARWPDINSGTWRWDQPDFNDGVVTTLPSFFSTASLKSFRDAVNFSGWANGVFSSQTDIRFYGFNYINNKAYSVYANVRWGFGWNENGEGLYTGPGSLLLGAAPGSDDISGGIGMDSSFGNYSAGDKILCCNNTTAGINRMARVEIYGRNINDPADSAASIVAIGGGHGGSSYYLYTPGPAGASGGSGGGASGYGDATVRIAGLGVPGQGTNGGQGVGGHYSGGGGGAGTVGISAPSQPNGGNGVLNDINGTNFYWSGGGGGASHSLTTGGNGGSGGGGGGAVWGGTVGLAGTGGINVGGNGGNAGAPSAYPGGAPGGNGGTNTGGGGGGGSHYNANNKGGNGGSGIIIVSYPAGSMTATGGTITNANGNTIHTFTSSGTFTIL